MEPFVPIPGKPPRKVVIDRQRKLFASLDIEELLLELVSSYQIRYKSQICHLKSNFGQSNSPLIQIRGLKFGLNLGQFNTY